MTKNLNVAIAGLGVVGGGVYHILNEEIALLNKRCNANINLYAVSSRSKKDFIDESKVKTYQNALDLAVDENIDVIIETIGGEGGIALDLCRTALKNKKHFITANKAMIAVNGVELTKLAQENSVVLAFEAAVAGAIPTLKNIKEGLIANKISKIHAILNGTCNYILTKMEDDEATFADALKQAQNLGYAEADPTFDIEGVDTAHKIAILAAIAKNSAVKFAGMHIEGITQISLQDIKFANELGYKIKLLGVFEDDQNGAIKQAVYPALVAKGDVISNVSDSFNCVAAYANNADLNVQIGRGAGSRPTASAIVADIADIANGNLPKAFGADIEDLQDIEIANVKASKGKYYLRFDVCQEFAKESNFIEHIFVKDSILDQTIIEEAPEERLVYCITTNEILEEEMVSYVNKIASTKQVDKVNLLRFV